MHNLLVESFVTELLDAVTEAVILSELTMDHSGDKSAHVGRTIQIDYANKKWHGKITEINDAQNGATVHVLSDMDGNHIERENVSAHVVHMNGMWRGRCPGHHFYGKHGLMHSYS